LTLIHLLQDWLDSLRPRPRPPVPVPPPVPTPPPPPPWPEPTQDQLMLLALTNDYRAQHRLLPLRLEPRLDHFVGGTPQERMAAAGYRPLAYSGECLAAGQTSPRETFRVWGLDADHRANLLDPHFRDVGFGRAGTIWAADFGTLA
jgi:uncharacterized protein YkwD